MRNERIGEFKTTGILLLCDPCYKREYGKPSVQRIKVAPGIWEVNATFLSDNIATLQANLINSFPKTTQILTEDAGVDSGQFGFFDETIFPYNDNRNYDDKDSFYGRCCKVTLEPPYVGIVDEKGVASSSGFGDGSYTVIVGKTLDGLVVDISVEFISEEEY